MKHWIATVGIIFFVSINGSAQSPQSVPIDEFQNPNCEDMWARLDNFAIQILNNPDAVATVEISGKANELRNNFYWEAMIRSYFRKRNIPTERTHIVRTALTENRFVRFWLTPPRAEAPSIDAVEWSMIYPADTTPFIFTNRDSDAVETTVCLYVDELAMLSDVMSANPRSRLNVVLIVGSERQFQRRKSVVVKELVKDYEISRSRIKVFKQIRTKPNPYGIYPDAEYWLLP